MSTRRLIGSVAGWVLFGTVGGILLLLNYAALVQIVEGGPNRWAPLGLLIPEAVVGLFGLWLWGLDG